jgi:hypothetical protein
MPYPIVFAIEGILVLVQERVLPVSQANTRVLQVVSSARTVWLDTTLSEASTRAQVVHRIPYRPLEVMPSLIAFVLKGTLETMELCVMPVSPVSSRISLALRRVQIAGLESTNIWKVNQRVSTAQMERPRWLSAQRLRQRVFFVPIQTAMRLAEVLACATQGLQVLMEARVPPVPPASTRPPGEVMSARTVWLESTRHIPLAQRLRRCVNHVTPNPPRPPEPVFVFASQVIPVLMEMETPVLSVTPASTRYPMEVRRVPSARLEKYQQQTQRSARATQGTLWTPPL